MTVAREIPEARTNFQTKFPRDNAPCPIEGSASSLAFRETPAIKFGNVGQRRAVLLRESRLRAPNARKLFSDHDTLDFMPEIVDNAWYARVLNIEGPCVLSFSRGCTAFPVLDHLSTVSSSHRPAFTLILDSSSREARRLSQLITNHRAFLFSPRSLYVSLRTRFCPRHPRNFPAKFPATNSLAGNAVASHRMRYARSSMDLV